MEVRGIDAMEVDVASSDRPKDQGMSLSSWLSQNRRVSLDCYPSSSCGTAASDSDDLVKDTSVESKESTTSIAQWLHRQAAVVPTPPRARASVRSYDSDDIKDDSSDNSDSQGEDSEELSRSPSNLIEWLHQSRAQRLAKVRPQRHTEAAAITFPPSISEGSSTTRRPLLVHFVFMDVGLGQFTEHPLYQRNIEEFHRFNPDAEIKVWTEESANRLVSERYSHLIDVWNSFPSKWYHIDFIRYLILDSYGGVYVDLDMQCTRRLPELELMDFVDRDDEYEHRTPRTVRFCNNVIHFRDRRLYPQLIEFSLHRLKTIRVQKCWKYRRFLYTVGARMYHRFCQRHKLKKSQIRDYFRNHKTHSMYKAPWSASGTLHITRS